jgi:hypothetical protein
MRVTWSTLLVGLCFGLNILIAQENGNEPPLEAQQEDTQLIQQESNSEAIRLSDFQTEPVEDLLRSENIQSDTPDAAPLETELKSTPDIQPEEPVQDFTPEQQGADALPVEDTVQFSPEPINQEPIPSDEKLNAPTLSTPPIVDSDAGQITEIDTMNLEEPKGNWLFKRFWWEKAEKTYEKIKNLVDKISESRIAFFQQRTDIDRTLFDPFYVAIGLEQGELRGLNEFFQNELQQERLIRGTLRGQERAFLQKLIEEKQTIQAIQNDLDIVRKIDTSIDDALSKLIERISEARNYERQAWDKLKAISRELSDLKAHENYLAMDAFWKNVNNINNYISRDFNAYFEELIQKAQTEIDRVKTASQSLREKGIDLRQTAQQLRQITDRAPEEQEEQLDEQEPEISVTWYQWIWNSLKWPFATLYGWVSSFFTSSASSSDADLESEQQ